VRPRVQIVSRLPTRFVLEILNFWPDPKGAVSPPWHRFPENFANLVARLSRSSANQNSGGSDLVGANSCISVDATVRIVRHPVAKTTGPHA